ncbi:hypothetical protein B0H14DRAFT_3707130 [Mycena olivaceomarginata]|nr:hypothetical protein B0H14DRAFT_3707130 [Mycena olivaceomarginata]
MQRSSRWWISPFIPLKVEGYAEESRHEGDIRITFIKLIFMIFQRSAVAKAAYGISASARIIHEFDVYNALRALQGRSIPTLFGLYRSEENGSGLVLVTSCEGRALPSFDDLGLQDRHTLLSRLIRIHQAGVEHPRCRPSKCCFVEVARVPSSLILTARRLTTVAEVYLAAKFVRWLDAWDSISIFQILQLGALTSNMLILRPMSAPHRSSSASAYMSPFKFYIDGALNAGEIRKDIDILQVIQGQPFSEVAGSRQDTRPEWVQTIIPTTTQK